MSRDRIAIVGKWKLWLGAGILAASWGSPLAGEPPEPRGLEPRSLSQPWNRRWDELKEPRYVERGNHRFFEIRHRAITVIAPTAEQAREAAAEAGRAWEAMSQLASHLPAPYDRREFALGSITVMIDSEPLRERNRPETTLGLADEVGLVYVNVAPGEPPLEEQMSRLRQGTAQAFLHVAQLDRGMPGWAVSGLASFVDQQLELAGDRTEPRPALEGVNRRAWERIRAEQDRLGPMPSGGPPSETVQFLLQADDARRAVDFFDALAATTGQVKQPDRAFRTFGEEPQPEQVNEAWERLLPRDWESRLAAWREDPLAGQPLPEEKFAELPPELQLRGAEMGLLLKLARRLEEPVRGGIAPKIVGLDDAGRPADFSPPRAAPRPLQPREILERLTAREPRGWATLDLDGSLLFSFETDRLEERFGLDERRYYCELVDGRWTLATRAPRGEILRAWLEDDLDRPARPWLRVEVESPAPRAGVGPAAEPNAEPAERPEPEVERQPVDREAGLRFLPSRR